MFVCSLLQFWHRGIDFPKMEPLYFRVNPGLVKKCCSDPFLHSCPVLPEGRPDSHGGCIVGGG